MKFVIGNWKMNGSADELDYMIRRLNDIGADCAICVPFTLIRPGTGRISIGAQDCSMHESGSFTGEISPEMIKAAGGGLVIVGHPERRKYFGETDEIVRRKAENAVKSGLLPIICVESAASALACAPGSGNFFIVFEPAESAGANVQPVSKISQMADEIKAALPDATILYGGGAFVQNAREILEIRNISGLLCGRASLKIETFAPIIELAKEF